MNEFRYAGFWVRAGARILDWLVQGLVSFAAAMMLIVVIFVVEAVTGRPISQRFLNDLGKLNWIGWIGGALSGVAFHTLFEGIAGTTVGKRLLKLQVVAAGGFPITLMQGLKRSIGFLADALFFGAIAWSHMKNSPEQQRVGDAWAQTFVVYRESVPPHLRPSTLRFLGALVAAVAVAVTFDVATEVFSYLWVTRGS